LDVVREAVTKTTAAMLEAGKMVNGVVMEAEKTEGKSDG